MSEYSWLDLATDDELREELKDLDERDDVKVTPWEGMFLESVCYKKGLQMTSKQRNTAKQIIKKYT